MVYLDYSATTPVNKEVLDTFNKITEDFFGNANSIHKLGIKSKKLIDEATIQIAELLKVKKEEIIYTSGASESNNQVIKGLADLTNKKHIITTELEHSSIYAPLSYLGKKGYNISFVKIKKDGSVDKEDLKRLLNDDTFLVTISSVNSETGVIQNINELADIIHNNSKALFHVDATQSIGKVKTDLSKVDLVSFSAHKFFGIKGIGCLIKKENVRIEPLIHGGKSTTIYRSGTPSPALIGSMSKALRIALVDIEAKNKKVLEHSQYLINHLIKYKNVRINSINNIPHILNFSVLGVKPETLEHSLEEYDIYISTQSACATGEVSKAVLAITEDSSRATSSVRVSISYVTTKEELDYFLESFDKCYKKLMLK